MADAAIKFPPKKSSKPAFDTIVAEISKIAAEIEDLPQCESTELNSEQMMRMQQIDFCSQRLQDLAQLLAYVSNEVEVEDSDLSRTMAEKARLEHTRDLFTG